MVIKEIFFSRSYFLLIKGCSSTRKNRAGRRAHTIRARNNSSYSVFFSSRSIFTGSRLSSEIESRLGSNFKLLEYLSIYSIDWRLVNKKESMKYFYYCSNSLFIILFGRMNCVIFLDHNTRIL